MEYPLKKKKPLTSNDYQLLLGAGLGVLFLFIFSYLPMVGIILAFKNGDYESILINTIFKGEWCGVDNFVNFFVDAEFKNIMSTTLGLNLLMLLINFPLPIIFALLLNEIRHPKFKKRVQSLTIFPHFLSWTIFGGIVLALTNVNSGVFTSIFNLFGATPVNLSDADHIWGLIIVSSLVKGCGWGSIIYLAAITGINPSLYEAAEMDGANRWQKMIYITLPSIAGTITVYLLLNISSFLANSYEQFYIFQNAANLTKSEVLTTYIYKMGLGGGRRFSYASAMGLFESVVNLILLLVSNFISKKTTGRELF